MHAFSCLDGAYKVIIIELSDLFLYIIFTNVYLHYMNIMGC
jgi:hypothetical protein